MSRWNVVVNIVRGKHQTRKVFGPFTSQAETELLAREMAIRLCEIRYNVTVKVEKA